jgi:uncharacterized protein (DUF1800 family)
VSTVLYPTMAAAMSSAPRTAVAPLSWNPTDLLLSRFAFGPTPASRAQLASAGPDAWFAAQVSTAASHPGYTGNTAVAAQGPLLKLTPLQVMRNLKATGHPNALTAMDQLSRVTIGLQTWSPAQLYERLVDFFSDVLHVQNHNGSVWTTRAAFDRDVIRKYAMGSFTDMLLASAKHPAMLIFLSLAQSTKAAVNENYGREVLELHTVGRVYSESDVKNCAALMTGRTLDPAQSGQAYKYDPTIHPVGPVTVLGFTHPNATAAGGEAAGDALLRYLAAHPATAQHLARRMCVRFVSDDPSPDLVTAVAQAYLANNTQILPMVSTILRSSDFWASRGQKVRRPAENLVAAVRMLGVSAYSMPLALKTLHWASVGLGDGPLDWPAPDGYPDVAESWRSASTLLGLWTAHLNLVLGSYPGFRAAKTATFYDGNPANSWNALARMSTHLTGSLWSANSLAVLQNFLGEAPTTTMRRSALGWLDPAVAALILDGPHFALH